MEHSKVSLETIAKELGVSKVTVSKALNDKEGVGEELRKKIKDKAAELGYQVNAFAKALKSNKALNIGIIIPERFIQSSSSYYFEVYALLIKNLSIYNYNGIMEVLDKNSENNLILPKVYLERKVDGIIVLGECEKDYLSLYEDLTIPVLFFDFKDGDINVDSITLDNFYCGEIVTKYLIENGHKDIGFIGNIYTTSSIKERFLGYYRALLDYKLPLNYDFILSDRDDDGNLVDVEIPEKLPTAFVCNNDQIAYEVVIKLLKKGIKVPEDISIVAFDNTIYSELCPVKLTTIDTNKEEMVEVATKAIMKKINVPTKVYDRILVKGKLINRDSVIKKEI